MKIIGNLLLVIVNIFLTPFMCYKVYTYFSPEVGFDLPILTYWNIFALVCIVNYFRSDIGSKFRLNSIYQSLEDNEEAISVNATISVTCLIGIGFAYLIKILIF